MKVGSEEQISERNEGEGQRKAETSREGGSQTLTGEVVSGPLFLEVWR